MLRKNLGMLLHRQCKASEVTIDGLSRPKADLYS